MDKRTRARLHILLDVVIDDEGYPWFWFNGGTSPRVKVKARAVEYEEQRSLASFGDAVTRACEAAGERITWADAAPEDILRSEQEGDGPPKEQDDESR